MSKLRGEEEVARATIEATLGLMVKQHDDGSQPRMHDLNILVGDLVVGAVEVTTAADSESIELWNSVTKREGRWIVPELRGGWMLRLRSTARGKHLIRDLPDLLREFESSGVVEIPARAISRRAPLSGDANTRAERLGIVCGSQSETDFPGSIYLTIEPPPERSGGSVDESGNELSDWLRNFLCDPSESHNLGKLERSGVGDRHAFIWVPGLFGRVPFGVLEMLWRDRTDVVPHAIPNLPEQVTHVWVASTWTRGSGLRWSPRGGWARFDVKAENN